MNIRKVVSLFLLFCFIGSHSVAQVLETNDENREAPNIIFILTDDLGWGDVGIFHQNTRREQYGSAVPWLATPNLDQMAKGGARLTNHYAGAPVCAPSRASLLLGLSQGHANVRNNQFDKALADNHTLASVLKEAGYATAAIGKWGLQGKSSSWRARPRNRGFDYFLGYMRHGDGHEHYPKEGIYRGKKEVWQNEINITPKLDKAYTADLWTAGAKKWITEHQKGPDKEAPFFLYLAYDTPHAVMELPAQDYPSGGGLNGGLQWTGKAGKMINTASGKVDSWMHPDYAKATYDEDEDPSTSQIPWPDVYKRYATAVRRIDSGVGDLKKLLGDMGIASNTLIVFSSDNGPTRASYLPQRFRPPFFQSYGPFDGIKRDTWEGGLRMPTIAFWPGHIPENNIVKTPSIQYDWLATFADVAGITAPANTDGVSLVPTLTKKGQQEESRIYVEYLQNGSTPKYEDFEEERQGRRRKQMQMLRLGDYVGVRYNIQSAEDDFEIYNVVDDPSQQNNLAENVEQPLFVQELEKKMKKKVLHVRRPDTSARRPYDSALIPPSNDIKTIQGIRWEAFKGAFPWVPKVSDLDVVAAGRATRPSVSVRSAKNEVLRFKGYIKVPKDGTYTLYLTAASKALLRLHEATLIDADYGYESGTERSGTVHLKAGNHAFRLYMKKTEDTPALDLEWKGPGIPKQPIPAGVFVHGGGDKN